MTSPPKTLFEKVWDAHVVKQDDGAPAILYIDTHLIHEVTSGLQHAARARFDRA